VILISIADLALEVSLSSLLPLVYASCFRYYSPLSLKWHRYLSILVVSAPAVMKEIKPNNRRLLVLNIYLRLRQRNYTAEFVLGIFGENCCPPALTEGRRISSLLSILGGATS